MLFISFAIFAQTEATTPDGKKVILNNDGTWLYAECGNLIKTENLKGKIYTSGRDNISISETGKNTGIDVTLLKGTGSTIINFKYNGSDIKCVSKDAPFSIEFADGTKIDLKSMADLNCEGSVSLFLGEQIGNEAELKLLTTKKIKKLIIEYSVKENGQFVKIKGDYTPTAEQADKIMKTIKCLANL